MLLYRQKCTELEKENKYLREQNMILQTQNLELTRYVTGEVKNVRNNFKCTPPYMYSIYKKPKKRKKEVNDSKDFFPIIT